MTGIDKSRSWIGIELADQIASFLHISQRHLEGLSDARQGVFEQILQAFRHDAIFDGILVTTQLQQQAIGKVDRTDPRRIELAHPLQRLLDGFDRNARAEGEVLTRSDEPALLIEIAANHLACTFLGLIEIDHL